MVASTELFQIITYIILDESTLIKYRVEFLSLATDNPALLVVQHFRKIVLRREVLPLVTSSK
jgi:hypothetical protein